MDKVAIGVMCYVNRSGSTLISRLISDNCISVYVFPEVGFIINMLIARQAGLEISGNSLYSLVASDPRIATIGIGDAQLKEICLRHSSKNTAALLIELATEKLGMIPNSVVIKHEKLGFLLDVVEESFPNITYLHIVRDPRAVANSMLRTPVPEKPGFNMARGSILYPARHWRQYIAIMKKWGVLHRVVEVRYEDLVV